MTPKTQFISDLRDKDAVNTAFLVKYSAVASGKTGKPYLNLILMDRSGEVEARIWDDVSKFASMAARDAFVSVEGTCQLYQGRKQVVIKKLLSVREDQIKIQDFVRTSEMNVDDLYDQLVAYVNSMKDPFYQALARSILIDDAEIVDRVKRAPAAKTIHHAYRGGLLEHVISITGLLDFISQHYAPHLDRDLLFLGGFLHDIAKIWELSFDRGTDYTDEGKLLGHLVMGVELIERKVQEIDASGKLTEKFPNEKKLLVKHMIVSHHGKYEYGSPKLPQCLEAVIVHAIDDLDSKINAIKMFIEADTSTGSWTLLNKSFERYFFKPEWARKQFEGIN